MKDTMKYGCRSRPVDSRNSKIDERQIMGTNYYRLPPTFINSHRAYLEFANRQWKLNK